MAAVAAGALSLGGVAQAAPAGGGGAAGRAESGADAHQALQQDFAAAAKEFHVPEGVLLAVAYHQSLWDTHGGKPSTTGNYNVMGLTHVDAAALAAAAPETDERGLGGTSTGTAARAAKAGSTSTGGTGDTAAYRTLDAAAELIGRSQAQLRGDAAQSVRGGAALLARYEKQLAGSLPADPGAWYAAVARFSQSTDAQGAAQYADRVYATLKAGAARVTDDGQQVTLAAEPAVVPQTATVEELKLPSATAEAQAETAAGGTAATPAATPAPECPSGLTCNFVPAAYKQNSATDKSKYGNYDIANRPADGDAIKYIVIHDTEGSYSGSLALFQDPTKLATPHYIVRSSDGLVTQLVQTKNVAWHAGNYYVNAHSIGIEHEGVAVDGASWYSESMYESSAALVRYLAAKFNVPLDRQHIIGHDDVPSPQTAQLTAMHWDPGPFWNWSHYMDLLGATPGGGGTPIVGGEVTIDPPFTSANEPALTGCSSGTCSAQPASFVYLRTSPSATAALIGDSVMAGLKVANGSTQAADVTDKAVAGESFVVAGVQGDWTAIWYGGQKAWFYNPGGVNAVANGNTARHVVTPAGGSAVQVYGRAYPEASAYPSVIADVATEDTQVVAPLGYTIPAGQSYVADDPVTSDYYYAKNIDQSAPGDQTRVVGTTVYYPIRYNHRLGFVKAADVTVGSAAVPPAGTFTPVGPTRIMDTRNGTGVAKAAVGAGKSVVLQVAGKGGVPSSGVTGVVMNVTAVGPTAAGHVDVYPDGSPAPITSNLNFPAGRTIANLVVVPVTDGKVDLRNALGSVNLLADVVGYYTASDAGSRFDPVGPTRIMDTRNGTGVAKAPVRAGTSVALQVTGGSTGIPASGVKAVVMNVTAVRPTTGGYLSVYPDGSARPATSSINFVSGTTIPNLVVVPVVDGKVDFYNSAGSVDVLADVTGYYAATGSVFHSTGPTRIMDTRNGTGGLKGAVAAGKTVTLKVAGHGGLPASGVTAVVMNVTAVGPTTGGYVIVYPDGTTRPNTSNLNFPAKQTIPNLVVVPVVDGSVAFYNSATSVNLLADITGYYTA
ncbi:N-acetylmuramoyl-L-alanine amidase [Actinacidiphila yeochonensis]|uniref:N-acetylmuramoyl-L-alanine amidase n=1 Tax=Actinacidiphila yeochonensis TaxID=89050 RepID=UPI000689B9CA|nr:peptidoglycan recognition family protein [Actinacidiphila yeochonensis]